ncbi:MAG: rRNA maturation RNase YbeY [Chloroflexi bacterium]|nr:rRNA maturation RNase YbeY [Chloroflexota bacterium]
MSYAVNIHNELGDNKIGQRLSAIGEKTLSTIKAQPGSLSIALVDDSVIQDLNLRYRGFDWPTDVLAFHDGETDLESGVMYFGDVIISIPTARMQADSGGHSLESELALLTIHGVLHLMGYDHQQEEEAALMGDMQADILHQLGLEIAVPDLTL